MGTKWWKYKDTDVLNKVQYEEAIAIQDEMLRKKFTTKYYDQKFRFHLLANIHRRARRDNDILDSLPKSYSTVEIFNKKLKIKGLGMLKGDNNE